MLLPVRGAFFFQFLFLCTNELVPGGGGGGGALGLDGYSDPEDKKTAHVGDKEKKGSQEPKALGSAAGKDSKEKGLKTPKPPNCDREFGARCCHSQQTHDADWAQYEKDVAVHVVERAGEVEKQHELEIQKVWFAVFVLGIRS